MTSHKLVFVFLLLLSSFDAAKNPTTTCSPQFSSLFDTLTSRQNHQGRPTHERSGTYPSSKRVSSKRVSSRRTSWKRLPAKSKRKPNTNHGNESAKRNKSKPAPQSPALRSRPFKQKKSTPDSRRTRASHLTPREQRVLIHIRRAITALKTALACKERQIKRLEVLRGRLSKIRDCLYNGLNFAEYALWRDICRHRSEALEQVRRGRRGCRKGAGQCRKFERAKRWRTLVLRACDKIGWDGERNCDNLQEVKKELAEVQERGCGSDESVEDIISEIGRLRKRVKRLKRGVRPSNAPRRG